MKNINYEKISSNIEKQLNILFKELHFGIDAREDSRAFGAMIEKKITNNWEKVCKELGYKPIKLPGKRTIYDFACLIDGKIFGFDVKTKDLGKTKYSDGGVCAVGNLFKYMANDNGTFLVVEVGHNQSELTETRDIEYIRVAPFHCLPPEIYRIENLGTGQVRLNDTIKNVWTKIAWKRSNSEFFDVFSDLALVHYKRVETVSHKRIDSIILFKQKKYEHFKFIK